MNDIILKNNLKEVRSEKKVSQEELARMVGLKEPMSPEEVTAIYKKQYDGERFVHVTSDASISSVVASNHAQVSVSTIGNKVIAFGAIDNLVKGASGQAVQCMNLMLGLNETAGLNAPGLGV